MRKLPWSEILAVESGYETVYAAAGHFHDGTRLETLLVDMGGSISLVRHWDCNPDRPEQGSSGVEGFATTEEALDSFAAAIAENEAAGANRAHPCYRIGWLDTTNERVWWVERTGDGTNLTQEQAKASLVSSLEDLSSLMERVRIEHPQVAAAPIGDLRASQCLVIVDDRNDAEQSAAWQFALRHADTEHFVGAFSRSTSASFCQRFDTIEQAETVRRQIDDSVSLVRVRTIDAEDRPDLTPAKATEAATMAQDLFSELPETRTAHASP